MSDLSVSDKHHLAQLSKPKGPPGLRDRRKALGLTLRQLAHLAEVSDCALSYAERGATQHCGERAVAKIADQLARLEAAQ
jgi:predicted transcriptional regulator